MKLIISLSVLLCFITSYGQDYNARILTTENGLPSDQIYYTFEDSKGFIWIGTKNGVVRWDSKYFEYYTIKDGLSNNEIVGIMEDSKERIWFLSFNNSVSYYQNGKIYNQQLDKRLEKIKPGSGSNFIQFKDRIFFQNNTKLLYFNIDSLIPRIINTNQTNELFIYKDSMHIIKLENQLDYKFYINNLVKSIGMTNFIRSKLINIGILTTQENMANIYSSIDNTYKLNNFKFNNTCLLKQFKNAIVIKKDNSLNFIIKSPYISKINTINFKKLFDYHNNIYCINNKNLLTNLKSNKTIFQIDNEGSFYNVFISPKISLMTYSKNVFDIGNNFNKIDYKNMIANQSYNKIKANKVNKNNINFKFSMAIENSIYIGDQLGIFRKKDNTFTQLNEKRTYFLFIDSKNNLWYSTTDSLFKCRTYIPKIINEESIILDSKFKPFINEIKEDKFGNLIFATNNGVYLYHPVTKVKYWLNELNFLSSNECNRIELDPEDNSLWVSTFNGLNHLKYIEDNHKLKFQVINRFFKEDGLYTNEINDFLIQGDSIWIATPKGLNLLTNKYFTPDTISLPLYFNKLFVNEQLRNFEKLVDLKSEENNIRIDFSAIYFQRRDRLLIQYKLITNGDTTIKYITENTIQLLALKDGTYELQLFAYDKDYPYIKSEVITLKFNIKPPFYKAWWFWTFVFFIGLILIGIYLYRRLLTRKNAMIKEVEMQSKLKEYSLKGLQNQMNPHFVFNSLNTILHFISKKQEREAYDYLAMFSVLIRKILENGRIEKIQIKNELTFLKEYTALEMIRYENKFDIKYKINIDIEDMDAEIPTMLIQPIIENAIKHGVSNLIEKRGLIIIEAYIQNEDYLFIRISDNGMGKHTEKKSHTSTALNLIKERLELYAREGRYGKFLLSITSNGATAELLIPI